LNALDASGEPVYGEGMKRAKWRVLIGRQRRIRLPKIGLEVEAFIATDRRRQRGSIVRVRRAKAYDSKAKYCWRKATNGAVIETSRVFAWQPLPRPPRGFRLAA
jgi:hypothetical protein